MHARKAGARHPARLHPPHDRERSREHLFYIVEELERRGTPTELAFLLPSLKVRRPNPQAVPSAKAAGMWHHCHGLRDFDRSKTFPDDRRMRWPYPRLRWTPQCCTFKDCTGPGR